MIKYALKDLIAVGQLYKSTGIRGEIIGDLDEELWAQKDKLPYIFIAENGQSVPYFVEYIKEKNNLLFKIEGIDGPEDTSPLINKSIYLDQERLDTLNVDLTTSKQGTIGFSLYNRSEYIGKVSGIQELPGQNVIELEDMPGVLIPMVEDWIIAIDMESKTIKMDFDSAILSLND